jgi:hypothetical protein
MGDVTAREWLTQEIQDLLAMGTVGLYEFIWGLNGTSYGLSQAESFDLSRLVAQEVVQSGQARLFAVRWPDLETVEGPMTDYESYPIG